MVPGRPKGTATVPGGAEYSLALGLLAWVFVALQIYLYTLTVFPGLNGTHFIFWHALHPVVPLALASAAWHGQWGAVWALVVVALVALVELGYLVVLAMAAVAVPAAEQGWLLAGSVAFLVVLGLAAVVLVHRIVALRGRDGAALPPPEAVTVPAGRPGTARDCHVGPAGYHRVHHPMVQHRRAVH